MHPKQIINIRRREIFICTFVLILLLLVLIVRDIRCVIRRCSPAQFLNGTDLSRYANVTWPRRRVPRVIHQTYRTYDIPAVWNASVQSVLQNNADDFQYRRWSHADMDAFVRQHEPEFYWNTYATYRYDMQRIDSFRYVLLFHIGGIYIDMDNGCNRPFRELVNTMEALDPDSPQLVLFPVDEVYGLQSDFMISTAGHPLYKQFISRLHYFNHYFFINHLTMLLSAGPLYASVQEHFFNRTDTQVVRFLDIKVYHSMFWKTNGGTWHGRDTQVLLYLYYNRHRLLWYCKLSSIGLTISCLLIMLHRKQRRCCRDAFVFSRSNYFPLPKTFQE